MITAKHLDEAQKCRDEAGMWGSQPEATFLLRVADAFEELGSNASFCEERFGRDSTRDRDRLHQ